MNTKRNPSNAVTIIPSDVKVEDSSEKIQKTILKIISSVTEKLKVKNVKRINGNGILVETAGQKDFATLLENQRSKKAGRRPGKKKLMDNHLWCPQNGKQMKV